MEFQFDAREQEVQALARKLAQEVLAPRALETDRGAFPVDNLKALGRTGLLGIRIGKEHGGLQASNVAYVAAIRELASACASTAVTVAVTNMVGDMIERFGTAEQKARHLPRLVSGEYLAGSFALSEPGAGSDAAGLRTRARKVDGGWRLDGSKLWITSGDVAGVILVMAKTDADKGARGITAFLVEPKQLDGTPTQGFQVGRHEEKLGLRGSSTVALSFQDVFVPDSALLGQLGQGFEIAMVALDGGRCGIGAQALGMGFAALQAAAKHVQARATADKALNTEQIAHFRLADAATRLDAGWLLVLRAAWLKDQGKRMTQQAAMAKVFATEAANFACQQAIALLGPAALERTHPVARALRDVRVSRIYEGTSEIQRLVIARSLAAPFARA